VPYAHDDHERWNGERRPLDYYCKRYGVTHTYWRSNLHQVLQERKLTKLHTLSGVNADSGNPVATKFVFPEIKDYTIEEAKLHSFLGELRAFKTPRVRHICIPSQFIRVHSTQCHITLIGN
jgi:hypothetical protein